MCRSAPSSRGCTTPRMPCARSWNPEITMTDNSTELREQLREKLFDAERMSPALRASYQEELERMTNPALTPRSAIGGSILLVLLLVCTAGIVRSMIAYAPGPLWLLGWGTLAATFAYCSRSEEHTSELQ